ncbi:MAG: hypothetical protein ABFE01_05925 [Phycisphaerales bacterium]
MPLTEQDRDTIKLLAFEIGERFAESQSEALEKMAESQRKAVELMIEHHQATCPHGRKLLESRWFLAGVAAVFLCVTTGGSLLGGWILKVLTGV